MRLSFDITFLLGLIVILLFAIIVILLAYPGPKRSRKKN